jgi:predicted metal-dependent phosphoesterase TrpH
VIDLHLHTTASDGRSTPRELVTQAATAGLTIIAVTDHDTTAAFDEVRAAGAERGIEAISGIEITAVEKERDVHVLGYFVDPKDEELETFLSAQRDNRIARVREIGARLASLGLPVDIEAPLAEARRQSGRSVGRPQVARAMVAAGHVADTREAFDKWLARGCPGFVPRTGAAPETVIAVIHRAGGLASLAHPGKVHVDDRIPLYRDAGLDALEAFHSDHDAALVERYLALARSLGLLVTGGSDYHGDPAHGRPPGSVTLPAGEWERLCQAHASR